MSRLVQPVLWDVQEEHLGEAEFCFELWQRGIDSPIHTLAELHRGPEERLMAHTMGLVVGGARVLDRQGV